LCLAGAAGTWLKLLPACEEEGLSAVGFCPFPCPEPVGAGFGALWLVVVVGVGEVFVGLGFGVVEADAEVVVEVVCGGGVVVVTVAAGVVAVTGGHDCETLVIGRLTGSGSELGGVPGGTSWKVNC
jgi:hypothetical protein